ncbi:hypothetical protein DDZ18_01315 [Marinicauda salina]|uniref:DUF1036 domain-containing protein n=1 Tax=Marinicauda salina TaxID=2135793 RepID=A0A2U2BW79_9PROT|nr:DUF1036 domain-containing protein [Marinicauda salina]PWE18275.1 hypothetical protein DDZ18_01315 [Marinicauda salina]
MISALIATLALQAAPEPPGDLVVELCNRAPFTAAVSLTYPTRAGERQRGWLAVEPDSCLRGGVGETVGSAALVHARSGSWVWPARARREDAETRCVSEGAHNGPAASPPCTADAQEAVHDRVTMTRDGEGAYRLSYTISCEALGQEAALCDRAPRAADGSAEILQRVEICRSGEADIFVGTGGPVSNPPGFEVERWTRAPGGACTVIARTFSAAEVRLVTPMATGDVGEMLDSCIVTDEGGNPSLAPMPEQGCARGSRAGVRTATFGPSTARFRMTLP